MQKNKNATERYLDKHHALLTAFTEVLNDKNDSVNRMDVANSELIAKCRKLEDENMALKASLSRYEEGKKDS